MEKGGNGWIDESREMVHGPQKWEKEKSGLTELPTADYGPKKSATLGEYGSTVYSKRKIPGRGDQELNLSN